jgi:Sulfotransferase domain
MADLIYGPDTGQGPEFYKARLRRHNDEVRAYFRDRPDDLLEIDISADPRWEPVCAFLGLPVPPVSFPHSNHRKYAFLPPKLRDWLKARWRSLGRRTGLRAGG